MNSTCRRWVCLLLAVFLPLHAALVVTQRTHGPSHGHAAPRQGAAAPSDHEWSAGAATTTEQVIAALRKGHGSSRAAGTWFVPHAAVAAHDATHAHSHGERHHHAAHDATVVADAPVQDANPESTTQVAAGVWAPPPEPGPLAATAANDAPRPTAAGGWRTHDGAVPERPPKIA